VSAEKCASFALFFQTTSTTRARACLCKAFALYEMGKTNAARREINEIKRLDSDLARVRRSDMLFANVHTVYSTQEVPYCLIRTDAKMLCSLFFIIFRT